jgi:hypothetical protein
MVSLVYFLCLAENQAENKSLFNYWYIQTPRSLRQYSRDVSWILIKFINMIQYEKDHFYTGIFYSIVNCL